MTFRDRLGEFATPDIRRGALFLIAVGTPVVAGVATGELMSAQMAAMACLMLSFADDAGKLGSRLRTMALAAVGLAGGAALGLVSRDLPAVFWPCVVLGAFAVGYSAMRGRLPTLCARDAAVGFVIGAILPQLTVLQLAFVAGGVAATVLMRSLDHLVFGPLPLLEVLRPLDKPVGNRAELRFAVAYAVAVTAAFALGMTLDPLHMPWIVTSTLVVMQPDAGASYRRILERVAGTFAGVAATWLTLFATGNAIALTLLILLIAANIPHHLHRRYWLHTALIAWAVLLMYALSPHGGPEFRLLLEERLSDMLIGCAIAVLGTIAGFGQLPGRPRRAA